MKIVDLMKFRPSRFCSSYIHKASNVYFREIYFTGTITDSRKLQFRNYVTRFPFPQVTFNFLSTSLQSSKCRTNKLGGKNVIRFNKVGLTFSTLAGYITLILGGCPKRADFSWFCFFQYYKGPGRPSLGFLFEFSKKFYVVNFFHIQSKGGTLVCV